MKRNKKGRSEGAERSEQVAGGPAPGQPPSPGEANTTRHQLHALTKMPEWAKLLRDVEAVVRKCAPAYRREDLEADALLGLVEWAERGEPVESWAGLAVIIAKRAAIKAARDRLQLHELEHLPSEPRTSYDDVVSGERADSSKSIRGSARKDIAEAIVAGENYESIAARLGKKVEDVRWLGDRIAEKIKNLEKTKRQSQQRGTS